jgi:hypothetical protein
MRRGRTECIAVVTEGTGVVNPHGGRGKASVCVPPCVHCMGSAGAAGPVQIVVPAAQITAAPNAAERRVLCDTIIVVSVSSQVPARRSMLGLLVQCCVRGCKVVQHPGSRHSSVSNVRQVTHFLKQSNPLCARLLALLLLARPSSAVLFLATRYGELESTRERSARA